mgnify:CR=1 FL=1
MVDIVLDSGRGVDAVRDRNCTIGIHPTDGCLCGDFAKEQCCGVFMCRLHKCGPRVGCRCPLPEEATP